MPTPNMNLDLPVVSTTLGPEWASLLNAALELLDAHDHASGKGAKVTPSGILINDTLDMVSEALKDANSVGFANRASFDISDYALGGMQVKDNDLYFITSAADTIQLTDGSAIFNPGGLIQTKTVASSYTVLATDIARLLVCRTNLAAYTLTLPNASASPLYFYTKDSGSNAATNNITINPAGGQTIDNQSSYVIDWDDGSVGLVSDSTSNWLVI